MDLLVFLPYSETGLVRFASARAHSSNKTRSAAVRRIENARVCIDQGHAAGLNLFTDLLQQLPLAFRSLLRPTAKVHMFAGLEGRRLLPAMIRTLAIGYRSSDK